MFQSTIIRVGSAINLAENGADVSTPSNARSKMKRPGNPGKQNMFHFFHGLRKHIYLGLFILLLLLFSFYFFFFPVGIDKLTFWFDLHIWDTVYITKLIESYQP